MSSKRTKEGLGNARQVRFPKDVQKDLSEMQVKTGLDFPDLVRLCTRAGMPIIKKRFLPEEEQTQAA